MQISTSNQITFLIAIALYCQVNVFFSAIYVKPLIFPPAKFALSDFRKENI